MDMADGMDGMDGWLRPGPAILLNPAHPDSNPEPDQ